ncbi:heat stress transcription factor B-4-like protein [Tanacetum coccineum]
MPNCILTPPTDESVIRHTQLSGVQGVDTQSHVLPTIQSQFSDIYLSFVSQQAIASQVIDDVIRQLSFDETELDREVGFADVARGSVDSSGLSHDESFRVDDMDLNLNEPVNLNVSQVETQSKLPVSEEPDVGRTQEPILSEVSTQEPIVAEVSNEVPIVEEVGTQEFSVEDVVVKDYVSSREDGEDAEQGNGQEDESAPTDGQFFYDDEGIDTAYETEYDVQYSEDAGTDDDDVDEDFLVDEENEIVEPDVDVYLFGINMDFPFDNIGITNLVSDDVLEGEDVDVINAGGFDSDPCNDEEKITRREEAKDRVYLHSIESIRNLKLYKNDGVRIRARCDGKVPVFTMSQGTGPTGPNRGMEAGPSGSSGPIQIFKLVRVNPDIPVKAVQDQLQRELEVQISMSKDFKAKAKAEREIRDYVLQYSMVFQRIYICLGALKLGFRACRRDLLGLDGAFMKGPFPGQVLVAVGLDSNNGIYPLAYALVEAEMIDKRVSFQPLKLAASATNVRDFEKCMLELKTMNPKAHEWLNKIPTEHWARSHFSGRAKSDLLLNNICEVFNGKIVGGRDKSVITLLEYIREYCMKRIVNVQGVTDKYTGPLTPTATRIMESIKKEAHLMNVQWNGANKYQVSGSLGDQCVVDVVSMTCSCRKWELTGIPYKHAITACWNMAPNDRAAPPQKLWSNLVIGEPRKKRKRSKHEDEPSVKDGKLSRKGRTITCQSCGNTRHNKATCKGQGRKATTGGNNAEASGSVSGQAQQIEPVVGQDGLGGSGAVCIGLLLVVVRGACVASQGSSIVEDKRIFSSPVELNKECNGREMGDGVPTQSSAAGGASEWSFL